VLGDGAGDPTCSPPQAQSIVRSPPDGARVIQHPGHCRMSSRVEPHLWHLPCDRRDATDLEIDLCRSPRALRLADLTTHPARQGRWVTQPTRPPLARNQLELTARKHLRWLREGPWLWACPPSKPCVSRFRSHGCWSDWSPPARSPTAARGHAAFRPFGSSAGAFNPRCTRVRWAGRLPSVFPNCDCR
jgi:hypothetical protein